MVKTEVLKKNGRRFGLGAAALVVALSLAGCGTASAGSSTSSPASSSSASSTASKPAKKAVDAKTAAWLKKSDTALKKLDKDWAALSAYENKMLVLKRPKTDSDRHGYVPICKSVIADVSALQAMKPFDKATRNADSYYRDSLIDFKKYAEIIMKLANIKDTDANDSKIRSLFDEAEHEGGVLKYELDSPEDPFYRVEKHVE